MSPARGRGGVQAAAQRVAPASPATRTAAASRSRRAPARRRSTRTARARRPGGRCASSSRARSSSTGTASLSSVTSSRRRNGWSAWRSRKRRPNASSSTTPTRVALAAREQPLDGRAGCRRTCARRSRYWLTGQSSRLAFGHGSQRHARAGRVPREGPLVARRAPAQAPILRGDDAIATSTRPSPPTASGSASSPRRGWPRSRGRPSTAARASARCTRSSSTRRSAARACPGIFDVIGVGMLGPTIIAHGDEDQKQRHLGPMLAADEVWCQLFSEPAAGSDLAGIQSRAQARGRRRLAAVRPEGVDHQRAARRFGLLLARTDTDVPKHKGLTMFIVPMDADGRHRRPLRQISGEAHFNEVFFDDVLVVVCDGGRVAVTEGRRGRGRCGATTPRARSGTCASTARRATEIEGADAAAAWHLAQALIAAESLGAVEVALEALGRLRQGALHVRPRDRLLPGGQARAGGDPAAARERPLADVLRGLGGAGPAGRAGRWPRGVPHRRRAAPSTTPRGRRSPSTAASAPPGSTTRRSTSAARSSRGGCSAARPAPPTGWPTSCSRRRGRRAAVPEAVGHRLDPRPLALPAPRAPPLPDREVHAAARARVEDGRRLEVREAEPVPWDWLEAVHDAGADRAHPHRRR